MACALALPIIALVIVPTGVLVLRSAQENQAAGFTFVHYLDLLSSAYLIKALASTLLFCSVTAALATVMALPTAWWIARERLGSRMLRTLCQVNFAFNGVVYGILVVTLLGNAGLVAMLERMLLGTELTRGFVYTTSGLAIGYLGFQIPRAASLLTQAIERLDPQLNQAARVLGASTWQLLAWIVLPQMARPLTGVFLAISMMSMASFGAALLIARTIDIFPVLIYKEFTAYGDVNRASAMGVILAFCCITLEVLARWISGNDRARTALVESK